MKNHSDTHNDNNTHQASGFFYREEVIRWILRIFYLGAAILFFVDFLIHRHIITNVEKVPTFYALYGFFACVILVVIAKWMRIVLIRAENYYDEPEDPADFLRNQGLDLPESEYGHDETSANKETS